MSEVAFFAASAAGAATATMRLKIPAAFLVIGAMSLGVPAIAAPVTPLSAAAKPMAQESELVQVRWHGGWRKAGMVDAIAATAPYRRQTRGCAADEEDAGAGDLAISSRSGRGDPSGTENLALKQKEIERVSFTTPGASMHTARNSWGHPFRVPARSEAKMS